MGTGEPGNDNARTNLLRRRRSAGPGSHCDFGGTAAVDASAVAAAARMGLDMRRGVTVRAAPTAGTAAASAFTGVDEPTAPATARDERGVTDAPRRTDTTSDGSGGAETEPLRRAAVRPPARLAPGEASIGESAFCSAGRRRETVAGVAGVVGVCGAETGASDCMSRDVACVTAADSASVQ